LIGKRNIRREAALSGQQLPVFEARNRFADQAVRHHFDPRSSAAAARTALMMF